MKRVTFVLCLSLFLSGCGHNILVPKLKMPTPPIELMRPPEELKPIKPIQK